MNRLEKETDLVEGGSGNGFQFDLPSNLSLAMMHMDTIRRATTSRAAREMMLILSFFIKSIFGQGGCLEWKGKEKSF